MKISIVTTMYKSAPYLPEFYGRIKNVVEKITDDYEIIFVNDGSPDQSLEMVLSFFKSDSKVRIIDLSRNFGHHKAIMTGLEYATGEYVYLIDCDLEELPEWLEVFYDKLNSAGADVVFGVQGRRKGGLWEKLSGYIFYKVFNWMSAVKIPRDLITARLMKRRYVKALVSHKEHTIFLAGLLQITGFEQLQQEVSKLSKSNSSYSFRKKVSVLVNSITSFSVEPLKFIFYFGFFVTAASVLYILYLLLLKALGGAGIEGWTSLIVSIWFLGGVTIFSVGMIGIYLSRVFIESKNRPYTIIKSIYGSERSDATGA